MWSQTLVIHLIRTQKIPFIESRASFSLTVLTLLGIIILTLIPFTPIGLALGFLPLSKLYFIYLFIIIALYMIATLIIKRLYISKYKELL